MYSTIKNIHILSASLTLLSFFIRGIWMMQGNPRLQQRWVKIAPHLVDSILLLSGITLVIISQQYPIVTTWLTAKFFALLLYIVLGSMALKRGKTKSIRVVAWLGALGVFFYLVTVALKRLVNPLNW